MGKTPTKKKERDRKERLVLETVRYGIAAVLFGGITAAPYAFINEYGHLEIFGGTEKAARAYAEFSVKAYGKMYRPVDNKPNNGEVKAAKAEQKRILAEEKALAAQLKPYRQFDNFTAADLRALQNKTIFVSERMFRFAAEETDWQEAKENNEIVIIRSPVLGQKTER